MKDYKTAADGSKALKKELNTKFPGIKFSVKSKTYSMGNNITINYNLGPVVKDVEAIADKYQEGQFDGMEDIYNYNDDRSFTVKNGGAKYVFVNRKISDVIYYPLMEQCCNMVDNAEYNTAEPWNSIITYSNGSTELIIRVINRICSVTDFRKVKEFKLISTGITCGQIEEFYKVI